MSVTLHTEPEQHTPAFNPVVFTFDSTNKTQSGFQYVVRARVNGSTDFTEWLIPASPANYGNGLGKKDFSKFASSYMGSRFAIGQTAIVGMADGIIRLRITVGEKYGTGAATGDMVTGDAVYPYNGAIRYPEFTAYDEDDRTIGASGNRRFLSSFPASRNIALDENAWLVAIARAVNVARRYRVKTYDSTGAQNGEFYISYAAGELLTTAASKMIQAPAGWNINLVATGDITVISGALPILDSAVAKYTIEWQNAANTAQSELITFNVVQRNCLYSPIRLHWVNRWGGIDSHTFDLVNKYRRNVEAQTYNRPQGEWSGNDFVFATDNPERVNYNATEKTSYKLISDYLNEGTYNAMEDLIGSPYVIADFGGRFIACRVTDTTFDQRTAVADGLFNIEVNVEFSQDNPKQSW